MDAILPSCSRRGCSTSRAAQLCPHGHISATSGPPQGHLSGTSTKSARLRACALAKMWFSPWPLDKMPVLLRVFSRCVTHRFLMSVMFRNSSIFAVVHECGIAFLRLSTFDAIIDCSLALLRMVRVVSDRFYFDLRCGRFPTTSQQNQEGGSDRASARVRKRNVFFHKYSRWLPSTAISGSRVLLKRRSSPGRACVRFHYHSKVSP